MIEDKNAGTLLPLDVEDELKKSFISYAMAVIVSRALPDVRDGLKPVHRRILYSMNELGNTPDKPHKKCARIVGEVLGKYHPHGDSSVYDALVRLAQSFTMRYMMVDGQGNFGSIDGDGAAAMRYTEARLSKLSLEMVRDIDKETVDFYPNFDETLMQPAVLPSRFPNLLVNGSQGIAVGMATNIPPHNLGEVIDAVVCMIDKPDCDVDDLMHYIKGPDFPTGGIILGQRGIYDAYHTGRGKIIVRAKHEFEEMSGNRQRIVVTEIPYMVNKAKLIEKIADLVKEKVVEGISDIRDESDRSGMRIVIELKRDVNANVVLNLLYKHTQLQDTFGAIMLALVDGEPKYLSLRQIIHHYLEHQEDVIRRRTQYDLNKAEARSHILEGLIIALDNIDEVVALIRASRTPQEAKEGLISRFGLTDVQAQAILDMRLQRLTGLERDKIEAEYAELQKKIAWYRAVLADEKLVLGIIREEILAIRDKFADERRTEISPLDGDIDMLDLIDEEDMVVTMTHKGYVKRIAKTTYRAQRRGGKGIIGAGTRTQRHGDEDDDSEAANDFVDQMYVTSTHDRLMFFTNKGRVYELNCYEIPEAGRTARGTAIVNLLQLGQNEKVTTMLPMPRTEEEAEHSYLVMATKLGTIKRVRLDEFENLRKTGLIAIILRGVGDDGSDEDAPERDELIGVRRTDGKCELLMGSRKGQALRFDENTLRPMGRNAMGVRAMNLSEDDIVTDIAVIEPDTKVLSITENGFGKRSEIDDYRVTNRGGKGVRAMNLTEKTGDLVAQLLVREDEDILLITANGTIIRTPVSAITVQGRATSGLKLMRVDDKNKVVCVARAEAEPEEETEETPVGAEGVEEAVETEGTFDEPTDEAAETAGDDGE